MITLNELDDESFEIVPLPFWRRFILIPQQTFRLYDNTHANVPTTTLTYWGCFKLVVWGAFHGLPFQLRKKTS
jgi:hypothetical protein